MKQNAPQKKTAAELEAERRRRDAEWWNRVIVFYLNQMYHDEVDRQVEKYRPKLLVEYMADYIREQKTIQKLAEKQAGKPSALELLQKMQAYQEEDSPFRTLMKDIQESPDSEEKISDAISRCVEEAPARILSRGRRKAVHVRIKNAPEQAAQEPEQEQADPEQARQEKERLRCEMAFLRTVMPPELYRKLCEQLVAQGRIRDVNEDFLAVPEQAQPGRSYDEFVADHKAAPEERAGGLDNRDEVLTAAAYTLAACEQKDEPVFDEKKAEARAMELTGSKAFRQYMKLHPGSLLAAAQNVGVEVTHDAMCALDEQLKTRDAVLTQVRDELRSRASGRSAAYHRMTNALHRFVTAPDEPSKRERDALAVTLAKYVMTEGAPRNPGFDREGGLQAAAALRSLLPENEFQTFLKTANAQRGPEEQITRELLDARSAQHREAMPEPEQQRPVPVQP